MLSLLLNHGHDLIIGLYSTGEVFEFNAVAESVLGLIRTQILHKNLFLGCNTCNVKLSFKLDVLDKNKPCFNGYIINSNGHERFFHFRCLPFLNKRKQAYLLIGNDITELLECKKYQLYMRTVIEGLPQYVYWKDINFVYQGCNKLVSDSLNLKSPNDIVGKSDKDLGWSEERINTLLQSDKEVIETGSSQIHEDLIPHPGSLRTMLTTKTALRDASGKVIGILGVSVDITDRKVLEKNLEAAKEKAEAARYIMTEFISNMGHMLVTPFSTISGTASILLYGYADRYLELKPLLEELVQGCADWEKVYHKIITATSLAEMEVKLESFSINQELNNIIGILKPSASAKNLKLIFKPFKPKKEDLIVTDRVKFNLILIELIANAIKFTEKGRVTVTISKQNGWYHIQIADTGIGIPSDKLDFVFQQYTMLSRAQKHGTQFKGVGAGLFLVKQRVKLIDGKIHVTSELNKGSIFTLSLPVHPNEHPSTVPS